MAHKITIQIHFVTLFVDIHTSCRKCHLKLSLLICHLLLFRTHLFQSSVVCQRFHFHDSAPLRDPIENTAMVLSIWFDFSWVQAMDGAYNSWKDQICYDIIESKWDCGCDWKLLRGKRICSFANLFQPWINLNTLI